MPRLSLQAIERQINALTYRAEKLRRREKGPALRNIVSLMREHEISLADIRAASGKGRRGRKPGARGKVKPMYRNPKTGETWSGRGRTVRWLAALEKAGHKRSSYLIKNP